jgi:hypothetical protein
LYFDMRAMPLDAQARAVGLAADFIRTQVRPGDLVAVMTCSGGTFRVRQDFTADRDRLAGALQQVAGDSREAFDADRWADGLRTAIERLGVLDGWRSLIYFTSGRYPLAADSVDAAVRGSVALYPIDTGAPTAARQ